MLKKPPGLIPSRVKWFIKSDPVGCDLLRSSTIRTEAQVLGNAFTGGSAGREITAEEDAEKLERHAGAPGLGALIVHKLMHLSLASKPLLRDLLHERCQLRTQDRDEVVVRRQG